MRTAVYPGGLDPITLDHYGVIERTAKMMDKLIVRVLNNRAKCPLFSTQERVNMLKEVTASLPSVEIQSFEGLLIDLMRGGRVDIVIRGPRAITDLEYGLQMAQTSRVIAPEIDTVFLTTSSKYSYLSSNIVKEIAECKEDISEFLHPVVATRVEEKLEERRRLA